MTDDSEKDMLRRAIKVLAVPWILGIAVFLGYLAGVALDRRMQLAVPVATISLVAIAVIGGGYQSYRIIMRVLRDQNP